MSYHTRYKWANNSWRCMIRRCNSPKDKSWKHYGGRGIQVCSEWYDFAKFVEDMGLPGINIKTGERLFIDRINNNLNYSKDNCRWATRSEQNSNRREYKTGFVKTTAPVDSEIIFEFSWEGKLTKLTQRA